jgi:hypothetical protein
MVNVSAAMGGQFASTAAEFTEEIRRLGPNPLKNADVQQIDQLQDEMIVE